MMIDISVILATRDEESYIGKTLKRVVEAVREARKRNINTEIIVVDSSTDNTVKEAKRFTKDVHAFPPKGISKARNQGAALAKGKILVFMDADTILQRTSLVDVFNDFEDSAVSTVISRVSPLYKQKSLSGILFYIIDEAYVRLCSRLKFLIRFYNRGDMTAVRKKIFDRVNGFNEMLCMLEVTDLLHKASYYGKTKVMSTTVFDSGRRLNKWGLLKCYNIWWRNYFCFYVLKRLYDSTYEVVR